MPLLSEELRAQLPSLYSQEAESEPFVYARWFLPGTDWVWYVIEGEAASEDYVLFGFVFGIENEFGYFQLSELESLRSPTGACVECDLTFTEGRLTDVVPAPDS